MEPKSSSIKKIAPLIVTLLLLLALYWTAQEESIVGMLAVSLILSGTLSLDERKKDDVLLVDFSDKYSGGPVLLQFTLNAEDLEKIKSVLRKAIDERMHNAADEPPAAILIGA